MTAPLVEARGLSFAVAGKAILRDVAFSVEAGEIRAVIGPNGAGKSTCVRCLAGAAAGWTGEVRVDGRDARALSRRDAARVLCYLPQVRGDLPAFSVRDYVGMGRYAHLGLWRGPGRDDVRAVERALADTGMDALADRLLPSLSGGERQMAALAAGLAQEARLLVLDEPATFLDPARQDMLLDLLHRVNRERGVSILMVTHDVNAALLHTRRTLALRDGRTVYDGPSRGLCNPALLERIYGMRFAFAALPGGGSVAVSARLAAARGEDGDA